jgi:hypothetical protein
MDRETAGPSATLLGMTVLFEISDVYFQVRLSSREAVTLLIFEGSYGVLNEFVIPTGAKRSGEPALSEVEGDLCFFLSIRSDGS